MSTAYPTRPASSTVTADRPFPVRTGIVLPRSGDDGPPVVTLLRPRGRATRHLEAVWGTVVTFDVRDPDGSLPDEATVADAIAAAVAELHRVDRVFSTYRADSLVSAVRAGAFGERVRRGPGEPRTSDADLVADGPDAVDSDASGADSAAEGAFDEDACVPDVVDPDACDPDAFGADAFGAAAFDLTDPDQRSLAEVIARCAALRTVTGGAFDPWAVPGGFDPSGLVKGWAADRVADLLVARGVAHVSVDAGGDVVTRGRAAPGRPWSIGVRHPADRQAIVATVTCGDTCVATSGTSERGEHVIDPRTRRPAAGAWAATVVGPDAGIADALATALLVDGRDGLAWFAGMPGWSAFVADAADAGTAWSVGPAFGQR